MNSEDLHVDIEGKHKSGSEVQQPTLVSDPSDRLARDDHGHLHHPHLTSSVYGAPAGNYDLSPSGSINSGYSVPHQHLTHGQYPSSSLVRPSDSYSVPSTHHHGTSGSYAVPQKPSDNYGLPSKVPGYSPTHHRPNPFVDGYGSTIDNSYKVPSPTASYGTPTPTYGPPTQTYGPPTQNYGPPSQNYGIPSQTASPVGIKPSYSSGSFSARRVIF